ncbi:hypothetical protein WOLCODRAFT_16795 [Wolfiporia cocos MD-104 SS10]|uniref:Uncharacterized protein n=1 Tax=Wolfiporia cocos (strain MD-104) TaxID=742152 RepID=A0A2H3JM63_WOLCO|nr:hypothetical protein WOLCODRAFT_16795 [Wolfiporia cocos MD-104 SS10]
MPQPQPSENPNDQDVTVSCMIPWDTGNPDQIHNPFALYKNKHLPTALPVAQQIASISKVCGPILSQLLEHYPENNRSDIFPNMHVYEDKGRFWELTDLQLKIWANAIASNTASLDALPVSIHFSDRQKLKIPATASPSMDVPIPVYPPPLNTAFTALTFPAPVCPAPAAPVELPHPVSLEEFCKKYNIPNSDRVKLQAIEAIPGNTNVENLPQEEWEGVGRFTHLA